ncbi:YgeY family selenium metabolism-linked hydrolase [Desulfogranum marinum]|uniref:YgeY family selenium metabolism-linked hydrolase n=1 Tax=Desulfogranum marinum TaxID=453220 RepID=UPI0029C7160E|nr:YgeY family selenium metabolism-linked hydrolase [Desulfogranum marinum]
MQINFEQVLELAHGYKAAMSNFLRDMVAIPSESRNEKAILDRIRLEMEIVGFDKIEIDPMGNILGYIGTGKHLIAMDAHVDTVGPGNTANWTHDPYQGYADDTNIFGLGTSDQAGGMAAMVYAGKIIKEMGLLSDYTLLVTGTVQEEVCDGLCWQYIIEEDGIRPEFVVCTEPSSGKIRRGQKGRMEIRIQVDGKSAHAAAPELGDNAIFKMGRVLADLEQLASTLKHDPFLGKGTLTVSEIFFTSPSRCAVADSCWISVDRRLTTGETVASAISEINNLPSVLETSATVDLYRYDKPSYTGLVYPTECYFPSWSLEEDHRVCKTLADAYSRLFKKNAEIDNWAFSTNGVAIMGRHNIPCIGFGPGEIDQAHTPDEKVSKQDLVDAAALYAVLPTLYVDSLKA